MAEGTLIVNAKNQIRIKFTNSKGKEVEMAVPDAELSLSLKKEPVRQLHGRKVELDEVNGQPKQVRPVEKPFVAATQSSPPPAERPKQKRGDQGQHGWRESQSRGRQEPRPQAQQRSTNTRGDFHNPYNFVPALPRDRVTGDLGDRAPIGQHVLHPDRYTGVIRVKMKVITPLLLPDAANAQNCPNDHKSFPVRVDADGKPYLPPTSIKSMLRSAYEAVTNSRLGVFAGHQTRLQFRVWDKKTRSAPKRDYPATPRDLLPSTLLPAYWIDRLSPADRVFGWVRQSDDKQERERQKVDPAIANVKSYKGNVRIGPVTCKTPKEQAIENFGTPGLPLAILGQPKPQQARFYVAKNQNGEAQDLDQDGNRLTKEQAGYSPGKGLRGRKVYPHHQGLPNGHWDNAMVELGALLWLLSLPKDHFHRFGGGKPLGFGSVRLEIDTDHTYLHDGHGWKEIYGTLDDTTPPEANRDEIVRAFQEAVRTAYGSTVSFESVPFIAAWLKMATGHADNLPTHYPRARQEGQADPVPPHPEGRAYEWFVANDRTGHNGGPQVSLPKLANDHGLPMLDAPRRGNRNDSHDSDHSRHIPSH